MHWPALARRLGWVTKPSVVAAAGSVVIAAALFSRFGVDGALSRDEAVYTYGGQQLLHGVAPYASIFDPKSPLATFIAGAGASAGHLFGLSQIHVIRVVFFLWACGAVLAVYLLALRLFRSAAAGFVAAVVFASFEGFAADALSGPDAKTPGIALLALSMLLMTYRRWFWAAVAGSLAFLVWQPFIIYVVVAVALAVGASWATRSWRAAGAAIVGAALPVLATVTYFATAGALGKFWEAAVEFPLVGVRRGPETVAHRVGRIVYVLEHRYRFSAPLFWIGSVLLVLLVVRRIVRGRADLRSALRQPLVCVVLATFLLEIAFACYDFQGYPDVYPLLVYPALGIGGAAAALLLRWRRSDPTSLRRYSAVGALVPTLAWAGLSLHWFERSPLHDRRLRAEEADGCAVERLLGPTGRLYALGDPTVLVMTERRNPDRFIYLGSGVDAWKVAHTSGGFAGWTGEIKSHDPAAVVVMGWHTDLERRMRRWLLAEDYQPWWVGDWPVFLRPDVSADARARNVQLSDHRQPFATDVAGRELPTEACR